METQIALLKKYGFSVRGASGQHLLIDPNVQRKIVAAALLQPSEKVLEIGPGLGALTQWILENGHQVLAVEKDERFVRVLEGELAGDFRKKFRIFHEDFLEFDPSKWIPEKDKGSWVVMSNLPYYITAPLLFRVLEFRRYFSRAILMMQKEVADRLLAMPGSKDYGRLTLGVRYAAAVRHLFDVSPACFTPKPEVDSAVVELSFHPKIAFPAKIDEEFLFHVIQVAFSHRRKTFLKLLAEDARTGLSREKLAIIFSELKLEPNIRGESLLLKDFIDLALALLNARLPPAC
ncbi:MAG: 16S rRNA (adenine(1518)-N(6)/adenine(1519)-N(6))-dimethyltransferase RsmA [Candidatus Omnitrophota bacterium]